MAREYIESEEKQENTFNFGDYQITQTLAYGHIFLDIFQDNMSSKIIVDTIEKKTGDDVTLVGNLDVPTSYKITGTDADSIQAPGLITSAGGGLNTSLNTGLASATYNGTIGSSATFPAGHINRK